MAVYYYVYRYPKAKTKHLYISSIYKNVKDDYEEAKERGAIFMSPIRKREDYMIIEGAKRIL